MVSVDVDAGGHGHDGPPPGRIARLRTRAERAADHYEQLAQRRPVLGLPLAFLARYTARQGILLASAIAFRLFLALMPLALLIAGIAAGASNGSGSDLTAATKVAGVTGAASQEIVKVVSSGQRSWWIAVIIGGFGFLWAMRTLTRSLISANAHAWQARLRKRSQKTVIWTSLIFGASLVLLILIMSALTWLDRHVVGGVIIAGIIEMVAGTLFWFVVSSRLPDERRDWLDLAPGCVMVGVALAVLHIVSRVYLPRRFESSSELYGSLGIAAVILAWLLIIGQVAISAAFVNSVWSDYRARPAQPSPG